MRVSCLSLSKPFQYHYTATSSFQFFSKINKATASPAPPKTITSSTGEHMWVLFFVLMLCQRLELLGDGQLSDWRAKTPSSCWMWSDGKKWTEKSREEEAPAWRSDWHSAKVHGHDCEPLCADNGNCSKRVHLDVFSNHRGGCVGVVPLRSR